MRKIIYSTSLCVLGSFIGLSAQKKEQKKTNVLFILADDYGYHDMSFTGSKFYETPNLDKLANESFVFNNGYAACQVSSPSRASILTGKFTVNHGITDWIGAKTGEKWRETKRYNKLLPASYVHNLDTAFETLPETLKKAGYKTFFAGKWHIGGIGSFPEDHGFDINVGGYNSGSPMGGFFSPYNNPRLLDGPVGENLTMRLSDETSNFIRQNVDKPFFAFLSFYAVHQPIQTTKEKWSKYRDKAERLGIQESGYKMGKFFPIRQVQDNPIYAGLIESMDEAIGAVLETLRETGLDKNTIVIFTSDNGGVVSGDDYMTSNKPLRGGKGYQFEGGIRVPYFIKVPGLCSENKVIDVPVIATDFYPTILDLLGLDLLPNEHTDGVSILPLFKNNSISDRSLIWHYPHYGNQGGEPSSVIRRGDWKLIYYYEDKKVELYNLKTDISEASDLSSDKPSLVKQLKDELFAFLEDAKAKYPAEDILYDEELEKKHLKGVEDKLLKELEIKRKLFLSKTYNPQNKWWGSSTVD